MITSEQLAEWTGSFRREVAGMIRKYKIGRTNGGVWQGIGHLLLDAVTVEAREIEHYPGIGIFGRPPDGSGELIVAHVGGENQLAAIGQRDEATRVLVDDVAADEVALYNSKTRVIIRASGAVEVRTHGGNALALATKADVKALADFVQTLFVGGTGSVVIPPGTVPVPTGTTKLKAE